MYSLFIHIYIYIYMSTAFLRLYLAAREGSLCLDTLRIYIYIYIYMLEGPEWDGVSGAAEGGCSGRVVQWMGVVLYSKLVHNVM